MELFDPKTFRGGWFVGSFEPTAYKTDACEVSFKEHKAGEYWAPHYHKQADEINYLLTGTMKVNEQILVAPVVFVISKGEVSRPEFITDVTLIVVKVPGVLNDKFEVS